MELLWRFLLGGALVSLFASAGDVLRPKRFAGLFGAAPSVALASLALTVSNSGPSVAATEARSMILSSGGFILYVWVVHRVLARGRWPASLVTLGGLVVWGLAASFAAGVLLAGGA
jgi:uncharacterized membrane protein (GlpM family)